MNQTYNPYDNVLQVVQQAADILGYSDSDIEAIKYPERELKSLHSGSDGRRNDPRIPGLQNPTFHFPRACKGGIRSIQT